jgi:hypothetical protein
MSVTSNTLAAHLVPVFKDAVAALINAQGANLLGSHLAKLPIPVIPETLAIDIDGDRQNDAGFALEMDIQSLDVLGEGDAYALLGGTINALTPLAGREVLGSRRVGGLQPQPSPVAAPVDLQARLKVDFVNQVLMAIYQSGADQEIGLTVKVEDFGSLAYQLIAVGVAPGSDVDIAIDLGGAPEMLVNGLGGHAMGLEALLPRASLSVTAPTPDGEQLMIAFTGDFWLDTSVGANPDGALLLEFGDLLKSDVSAVSGGLIYDRISGLPEETVHDLLAALVVSVARQFEPIINALLAAPRLELAIGSALTAWLSTDFAAVQAGGDKVEAGMSAVETGVSEDDGYLAVGLDIVFP